MRILRVLLIFVLLLLVSVVLLGVLKPSVSYGHEIEVNKPVEVAWQIHKDPATFSQWLKGFKSIERISGEQDAIGSKYKVIVNPGEGQEDFEMIQTVIDYKENDFVDLLFDSDMMVFEQKTTFVEEGGKTKIKTDSKVKGSGIMMRAMFAAMEMFTGAFHAQEKENMENLKKVIDRS